MLVYTIVSVQFCSLDRGYSEVQPLDICQKRMAHIKNCRDAREAYLVGLDVGELRLRLANLRRKKRYAFIPTYHINLIDLCSVLHSRLS